MDDLTKLKEILEHEEVKKVFDIMREYSKKHIEAVKKRKGMDAKVNTLKIGKINFKVGGE